LTGSNCNSVVREDESFQTQDRLSKGDYALLGNHLTQSMLLSQKVSWFLHQNINWNFCRSYLPHLNQTFSKLRICFKCYSQVCSLGRRVPLSYPIDLSQPPSQAVITAWIQSLSMSLGIPESTASSAGFLAAVIFLSNRMQSMSGRL
jgi:hypothetical protein